MNYKIGDWIIEERFGPINKSSKVKGALSKIVKITEKYIYLIDSSGLEWKEDKDLFNIIFSLGYKKVPTIEVVLYAAKRV